MSLPKPVMMRGMTLRRLKIQLPLGFLFAFSLSGAYLLFIGLPRKRAYNEFHKNYDMIKEYEAMRDAGVFESVRPVQK